MLHLFIVFRANTSNRCDLYRNWQWLCCGVLDGFSVHVWWCDWQLQCEVPTEKCQQLHHSVQSKNQCCATRLNAQYRVHCVSSCHQLNGRHEYIHSVHTTHSNGYSSSNCSTRYDTLHTVFSSSSITLVLLYILISARTIFLLIICIRIMHVANIFILKHMLLIYSFKMHSICVHCMKFVDVLDFILVPDW